MEKQIETNFYKHIKKNNTLYSKVFVEDLLKQKSDFTCIGIILGTEWLLDEFKTTPNIDINRINWTFNLCKDVRKNYLNGFHCGDCTNQPITCCRCLLEELYQDGIKMLNKWHNFETGLDLHYNDTDGSLLLLVCTLLSTEHLWRIFFDSSDELRKLAGPNNDDKRKHLEDQIKEIGEFEEIDWRYNYWNKLSDDEKLKIYVRAQEFKNNFDIMM
jgi:hypothetical protein